MKWILSITLAFLFHPASQASEHRVAILGDSITYSGRWPTLVESALRATPTFANAEIVNFGLASETVSGLSEPGHAGEKFPRPDLHERLGRILDAFKPTHVLACYGINDGIYLPLDETRQKAFQDGITRLKTQIEARSAKLVVITAPLFDGDHPTTVPHGYDAVLNAQATWLLSQKGWQLIDIRPDLHAAIAAAKEADPKFVYARDKIHPGQQGHDFIAASVARQLWPLWQLPGKPTLPGDKAFSVLVKRAEILKLAWLSETRHLRPGVPHGLPLEEAQARAEDLLAEYRALSTDTETQPEGH